MPSTRARFILALFAALCLLSFSLACGGDADSEEDAEGPETETSEAAALTPYKPTGSEGAVAGSITFTGTPPAPKPISMDQDPVCAQTNPSAVSEDVTVSGDKLANVFVYVKDGKTTQGQKNITAYAFDAPAQAQILDQKGCRYTPRVIGIQTKQSLAVTNSDATSHNVNVQAAKNEKFNQGQGPGGPPIEKKFQRSEILIPVKCNQHPWMRAYIGVLAHPFYAVSGADGKFEIKGLPPGTYTLVAWHERLGEKNQSITVGDKESKQQDFSFAAAGAAAELSGGSLRLMPALELPMIGMEH